MCCPWLKNYPPVLAVNEVAPKWQSLLLGIIELHNRVAGESRVWCRAQQRLGLRGREHRGSLSAAGKAELCSDRFRLVQKRKAWSVLKHGMSG